MPLGWERNDDVCYSRVISPDKSIAIAVVTGDDGTGEKDANPRTKYPKGSATQAAISCNQRSFFEVSSPVEDENAGVVTWVTRMLLKKRADESVLAGLSLPASMTKDGQVESWHARIILDPIHIDPNVDVGDDYEDAPIEVFVRRRS